MGGVRSGRSGEFRRGGDEGSNEGFGVFEEGSSGFEVFG
jgi:hypothetical protein